MTMRKIILASASPRRRDLLLQAGIKAEVLPGGADETTQETDPGKIVELLSRRKCLDVAVKVTDGIIIGADTVVADAGKILGKPRDQEEAFFMLSSLQGKTHRVCTGVTLLEKENGMTKREITFHEETSVTVYPMKEEEILWYIRTGEPMDKAGAYGIQGAFARFVKQISGDYNNVVGLPVAAVYQILKQWTDLS